jgi:hypothetical protein
MPKRIGGLNPLIFKDLFENGNFEKGKIVPFFCLKNNYLVTFASLTFCKRFRLEILYGGTEM